MKSPLHPVVLVVSIVLVSLNLRAAIAGVGPLLEQIQRELGASSGVMSLLTAIPVLCFGLVGAAAPRVAWRLGLERAILLSLALVMVGGLLRIGSSLWTILAGTGLIGAGIAMMNVLLPGFVKMRFPTRGGLMMGIFTMCLVGGAALAAGLAVPLRELAGGGWRGSLGAWAALALVGMAAWLPVLLGEGATAPGGVRERASLWKDPVAWQVTVYFGLQSLIFFAWLTWLPKLFVDQGLSVAESGWMLAIANAVQIPFALAVPIVAARMPDQRALGVGVSALTLIALCGLLVAPMAAPVLWVVLLGVSAGAAIALALSLVLLRARTPVQVAGLSAMSQGVGYLVAATGPFMFGWLYDLTGRWEASLGMLVGCAAIMSVALYGASRKVTVGAAASR